MRGVETVMSAAGPYEWNVVFDFDRKSQFVNSQSLKIVPEGSAIPTVHMKSQTMRTQAGLRNTLFNFFKSKQMQLLQKNLFRQLNLILQKILI